MEEDGFRLVPKSRRRKRIPLSTGSEGQEHPRVTLGTTAIEETSLARHVKNCVNELQISNFSTDFTDTLRKVHDRFSLPDFPREGVQNTDGSERISKSGENLQQNVDLVARGGSCAARRTETGSEKSTKNDHGCILPVKTVVCYGLGNFSSCVIARFQLAMLIILLSLMPNAACFLYDPTFIEVERKVLNELGYSLISKNEESKRQVVEPTLFYMPHCGKPLYNNLLWANWGHGLSQLVVVGNRFSNFAERFTDKELEHKVPYIQKILPYLVEFPIKNNFRYTDIFNDTALHLFPADLLQTAPPAVWADRKEPSYDHEDAVEIISSSSVR